jgi:DNA-binding beta-propeller fold protein YncE
MNVYTDPEFRFATRLADDRLLISCQATNRVLVADPTGTVTGAIAAEFNMPQDIAVATNGVIFVVDRYNHCVKVLDDFAIGGDFVRNRDIGTGELNQPVGIATHGGEIFVADNENHRIAVFNHATGKLVDTIGKGFGQGPGQLFCPCGVALYHDLVIVAEWGNGRLQVFRDGKSVLIVNGIPHAHHVTVDPDGNVYVAQYSHKRVRRIKIDINKEGGAPSFIIDDTFTQLDHSPCGLFWDDGKVVAVTKTKLIPLKK